ncbi:MAG: hypothetical protein JWL64_1196 [Frankiales bacterium]|nr:hypothetical protein [Frankiales bacterium]
MSAVPEPVRNAALQAVVGEVEQHVAEAGWDQPPQLFALVETDALLAAEPQLAETMGIVGGNPGALTPIAQEPLADRPLDEALATIEFGEQVLGVVLAHEVVVLPPSAEAALDSAGDGQDPAAHPEARDVRMVVGVLRGGGQAAVLRLRTVGDGEDDRLTGPDLAPGLAAALAATLAPGPRQPG